MAKEYMRVGNDVYSGAVNMAINIAIYLKEKVWGEVKVHYDGFSDSFSILISNRALAIEPFRSNFYYVSNEMSKGTSSQIIAKFFLSEYKDYVNMYLWKK